MELRLIIEEFVDIVPFKSFFRKDEQQINIFKNPVSKELEECSNRGIVRGVMFSDGNFYVADGGLIHSEILKVLAKINIAEENDFQKWNINPSYFDKFLAVLSFKEGDLKKFIPAESYAAGGEFISEKFMKKYYNKYKDFFSSKRFELLPGVLATEI